MNKDLLRAQLLLTETQQIIEAFAEDSARRPDIRRAIIACLDAADLLSRVLEPSGDTSVVQPL